VLSEWVSVDFHQPVFMVFEGMILVLIASFFLARKQLNWTHLLLILAFTHLALSQSRNVAIWSIAISPLLAFYLQAAILSWRPAAQPDETESPSRARPLLSRGRERTLNLALLVLALLLYTVEAAHFVSAQALRRDERSSFPAAALSYMNRHTLPGRTYADYAWGGYVLWKGYPRYRDFIDGRANTLFDTRILSAYLDIYTAAPDWQQRLSAYRIDNVLVDPGSPIAQILALNAQWKRVFKDSTAVLYTRQ
jgi:hypothetical protein